MDASASLCVLISRCFSRRSAFVPSTATLAFDCEVPAFSQAPFMASGARSVPSTKAAVSVFATCTRFSISLSCNSTSLFEDSCFRFARLALMSWSILEAASRRSCSLFSPSTPAAAAFSVSRFTAKRFMATKVRAAPKAALAATTPLSSSSKALVASLPLSTSSPFKKGISASRAAFTDASASDNFCSASARIFLTSTCSARVRIEAPPASSFSWSSLTRGCNFESSTRAAVCLLDTLCKYVVSCRIAAWHSARPVSASLTASGGTSWPSWDITRE
mmetsp:Transcript_122013/g.304483  ORF Transcript_122013/g.304483 Transcript_122013/m.304483 type:complete len:276 (+) Transcript_122013:2796-3623(+)